MKKFIAGVLAAASFLSVSAPAYASGTKTVTKQGELSFDVTAVMPKIVLKVSLPAQMKAAINPYGNDFQIGELNTIRTQNGIVSVAYPVHNYDTDFGVYIDATAMTTTSSNTWSVSKDTLTAGVKGANMAFTASDTEAGIANYSSTSKAATSMTSQGNLVLDSTVAADPSAGTAKGQTSQTKVAYVEASADGEDPSIIYIGFAGKLSDNVNWSDSDSINVNLILKLTPGPKTL